MASASLVTGNGFFDNLDTRKREDIVMPRVKDVDVNFGVAKITAPTEQFSNATKVAFYAERDSFQEEVKAAAKKAQIEPMAYYIGLMLDQALQSRYEYALSKREKVLKAAMSVLLATGKSEADARKMLGLGE